MSVPSPKLKSSGSFKSTLFGISISFGCIWVLTRTVDVDQTINALRDVDPYPLGLSVVLTAITVACRAIRWQALLRPESRSGFWSAVEATLIGYLFIAVLPGRVGELTRAPCSVGPKVSRQVVRSERSSSRRFSILRPADHARGVIADYSSSALGTNRRRNGDSSLCNPDCRVRCGFVGET